MLGGFHGDDSLWVGERERPGWDEYSAGVKNFVVIKALVTRPTAVSSGSVEVPDQSLGDSQSVDSADLEHILDRVESVEIGRYFFREWAQELEK